MRIPLHLKLMASYLVVVGLVLLPTAVYLRTYLDRDQRARVRTELEAELSHITTRLTEVPPEAIAARSALLVAVVPRRLTVIDPTGRVLGDSVAAAATLDNHRNRPEVRDAIARGTGASVRVSRTTREELFYVAMRFPREGALRGVARLSQPEASIHQASVQVTAVLRNAGAVALSAAVLLSLVAALAASRPLRRIAQGARAFADGDFGAPIEVHTGDEIEEVADALRGLASQLRARLVTAGVDRATLQALIDDVPVAIVLYDAERNPVSVNGAARVLCGLSAHVETQRAAELPRLERQRAAVDRVLRDGLTCEAPLVLPWMREASLTARWLAVFAPDGARLPALIVLDRTHDVALDTLRSAARALADQVLTHAGSPPNDDNAVALTREALAMDAQLPPPALDASAVRPVVLLELLQHAVHDVNLLALTHNVGVLIDAKDPDVPVVEAHERMRCALRQVLRWAIEGTPRGATVAMCATAADRVVRVSVRVAQVGVETAPDVSAWVRPPGGDAGIEGIDNGTECWILVPRA